MNSKRQNLEYTARIICKAAGPYKSNLIGRKFLYIFDNRYIEVIYKTNNFKQLTGVESELSAKDFFKLAKRGKLSYKNIYFSSTHPFQLSMKKLKHLNDIVKLSTSESFMLEEIKTNTNFKFLHSSPGISLLMLSSPSQFPSLGHPFHLYLLPQQEFLSAFQSRA